MNKKGTKRPLCRCSELCDIWNSYDKSCECYGYYHPAPSKCPEYKKRCESIKRKLEQEDQEK